MKRAKEESSSEKLDKKKARYASLYTPRERASSSTSATSSSSAKTSSSRSTPSPMVESPVAGPVSQPKRSSSSANTSSSRSTPSSIAEEVHKSKKIQKTSSSSTSPVAHPPIALPKTLSRKTPSLKTKKLLEQIKPKQGKKTQSESKKMLSLITQQFHKMDIIKKDKRRLDHYKQIKPLYIEKLLSLGSEIDAILDEEPAIKKQYKYIIEKYKELHGDKNTRLKQIPELPDFLKHIRSIYDKSGKIHTQKQAYITEFETQYEKERKSIKDANLKYSNKKEEIEALKSSSLEYFNKKDIEAFTYSNLERIYIKEIEKEKEQLRRAYNDTVFYIKTDRTIAFKKKIENLNNFDNFMYECLSYFR